MAGQIWRRGCLHAGGGPTLGNMGRALELVAVILFPTAAGYAVIGGFRGFRRVTEPPRRAVRPEPIERPRAHPPRPPAGPRAAGDPKGHTPPAARPEADPR